MEATFVMVLRDTLGRSSAFANPLIAETEQEKSYH